MYLEKILKTPLQCQSTKLLSSPLCVLVLVDSHPKGREEVEVPSNSFNSSHETQIYERFIEDVARHSCSKENIEELVVRLIEPLDSQIEFLVDPFDVRECLRAWYVHLNHGSRWAWDVLRTCLPRS